jgi:hypothetical protein
VTLSAAALATRGASMGRVSRLLATARRSQGAGVASDLAYAMERVGIAPVQDVQMIRQRAMPTLRSCLRSRPGGRPIEKAGDRFDAIAVADLDDGVAATQPARSTTCTCSSGASVLTRHD